MSAFAPIGINDDFATSKAGVSAFRSKSLACKGSAKATNSAGKMTVKLCPTTSTRVRLRGQGVLASKVICIRVKGAPCAKLGGGSSAPTRITLGSKVSTSTFLKAFGVVKGGGAVKITAKGLCRVTGTSITTMFKPGTCTISVVQASKGRIKGKSKTFRVNVV